MASSNVSITVIIPAYNEEGNLTTTVEEAVQSLDKKFQDYEVLIFNDCSTDRTAEIAEGFSAKNPRIITINNPKNMGLGYNFSKGVELASKEYTMLLHGDNETTQASVENIFDHVGKTDIVIPCTANTEVRALSRRIVSKLFTMLMNIMTGLRITYYNGPCVFRSSIIKQTPVTTWGFAYMAAILARLIKAGATYEEVPMYLQKRGQGESKAFKLKNIVSVIKTLAGLLWEFKFGLASPKVSIKMK